MRPAFSSSQAAASRLTKRPRVSGLTMIVVAISIAAWLGALVVMGGMDEGPGTPLHRLPVFLAGWIIMLTAMMLPSELNYIGAFRVVVGSRADSAKGRRSLVAWFISGYGVAWIVAAYALFRAVATRRPPMGLIHHSDRGSQYCALAYQALVGQFDMRASMSRRGNFYDNAPIESFWGTLKNELVYHHRFATREQARLAIS